MNTPMPDRRDAVAVPVDQPVRRQRPVIGAKPVGGGAIEWHGQGAAGHDYTLCGLSVDGDLFDPVHGNHRITCLQCRTIWLAAKEIRAVDFAA
jgi:hypothetical protein